METVSQAAPTAAMRPIPPLPGRKAGVPAQFPTIRSNEQNSSISDLAGQKHEPPTNSQESYASLSSEAGSGPKLQSLSSNLSTSTCVETELTSPASSKNDAVGQVEIPHANQQTPVAASRELLQPPRPITPRISAMSSDETNAAAESAQPSPMSIDTPALAQGSKRTASGAIKHSYSPVGRPQVGHSRNMSLDSNIGRIGELSAQLKTRLSYAMVKVRNGWEACSIEQLENLSPNKTSPMAMSPEADIAGRGLRSPPQPPARRRRQSAISESPEYGHAATGVRMSPVGATRPLNGPETCSLPLQLPNSTRPHQSDRSSKYAASWPSHSGYSSRPAISPLTFSDPSGSALAPPPDIISRRAHRRSNPGHVPPMLSTLHQGPGVTAKSLGELSSPGPKTPTAASTRHGILRMPSQQAEKDAVDTLLFMSSPNNSGNMKYINVGLCPNSQSAQPSPLRAEFPPNLVQVQKRVAFERSVSGEGDSVAEGRREAQSASAERFEAKESMRQQPQQRDQTCPATPERPQALSETDRLLPQPPQEPERPGSAAEKDAGSSMNAEIGNAAAPMS